MQDVRARRALIRAPPGAGAWASQRLTDAMRLAPVETRLLLVRRLRLGAVPRGAPHSVIQARTDCALAAARAGAVHGAAAAPWQDAVWFRSEEEARALLLGLLARRMMPAGWFWELAVPEWRGATLAVWLPRWVAAAGLDAARQGALARSLGALAADGLLRVVVPALEDAPAAPAPLPRRDDPSDPREAAAPRSGAARAARDRAALADPAPVIARLPAHVVAGFRAALLAARPGGASAGWIARSMLLVAEPSLAGHPARLARLAAALAAPVMRSPTHRASAQPAGQPREATAEATPPATVASAAAEIRASVASPAARGAWTRSDEPPPAPLSTAAAPVARARGSLAAASLDDRLRSRGAGAFLLVGPLVALGIGEWIAARGAVGFGPALLRDIAARQRIPSDDSLFDLLAPPAEAPDPAALCAWRVGLDRWLRRRVRRRVAEIARRPGTLALAGDRLTVGFPPAAADLALRRRALDRDPGWQPWLGLALFFRFGEDVA